MTAKPKQTEATMPDKRNGNCHCDDHGDVSELKVKTRLNCDSLAIAHCRLDRMLPRVAFFWTAGILIAIWGGIVSYQAVTLNSIHKDVTSIDKSVAVIAIKVEALERRNTINEVP